eukprot:TRINITY_DN3065_c0_g2_i1.p1 TRINITY_DN3065_c0_g2~~TRINITY_DN3065_c0_g2_i1.p1  ORF type:complete len:245 (+),score=45.54 TRINITY_DN3065_c0_g2_i1:3-737(+)
MVYSIIKERKKETREELLTKTDIFSRFLVAKDDNGKPFEDKYLRDVFMNFLLAGRDTTAALICWTLYSLSGHPDIEKKVLQEISTVVKGSIPTHHELEDLKYTKQVLSETLRLYPSVPLNVRECVRDTVLPDGKIIKKGTLAGIHPYVVGRWEGIWENPDIFDPDRFHPDKVKEKHPFAFIPFHAGPQTCLGQEMAYVEAKALLATVLPKFKFEVVPNQDLGPKSVLNPILVPSNGLLMRVSYR